jgi:hypothetical protein
MNYQLKWRYPRTQKIDSSCLIVNTWVHSIARKKLNPKMTNRIIRGSLLNSYDEGETVWRI